MEECRKQERNSPERYLSVFNHLTNEPFGQLANLSDDGAMIITPVQIKSMTSHKCRLKLANQIMGSEEIIFEAECRWCRKNVSTGMWESGYKLTLTDKNKEMFSYLVLSLKLNHWGDKNITDVKTIELENRRISDRYEFDQIYSVFKLRHYRQIGELADLSANGVRFITQEQVQKGETNHYRILLPKKIFEEEYLIFEAQCMWCRNVKDVDCFESGHKIVNISEKDAIIILHLLTHCGTKQQTQKQIMIVDKT